MSDKIPCEHFWCIHMDCPSYHTGDGCSSCNEYCECKSCICNTDSPLDNCQEISDQILHGVCGDNDIDDYVYI